MSYQFYFGSVLLPVTPKSLEISINNDNQTVSLINEGEINVLKAPRLTDITFTMLLPNSKYPFAVDTGYKAQDYLQILEELKTGQKPFQFIVYREKPNGDVLFKTNLKVTLEDYTITENAEEYGFDLSVEVNLKQYKDYGTKTLTVKKTGEGDIATVTQNRPERISTPNNSAAYTVKQGDTLWIIAKLRLGKGERWKEIYKLNQIALESDAIKHGYVGSEGGNLIFPGIALKLPRR